MNAKNLIIIGAIGAAAYLLLSKKTEAASVGFEQGGGVDVQGGYTPEVTYIPEPNTLVYSAPPANPAGNALITSPETQAAINAGTLNIFGATQKTSPPTSKFTQTYNAAVSAAAAVTGSTNIASAQNVLAKALPVSYGIQSATIQSAAKQAAAKKTTTAAQAVTQKVSYVDKGTNLSIGQKRAMAAGRLKYRD